MVFSPLYFWIFIFHFLFNFYFYPPNPPNPPNIYFMIRNIYRNILKVSGMVRKKSRGLLGGQQIFQGAFREVLIQRMFGVFLFCNVSLCVLMRNYRHNNRQFLRCVPPYGLVCIVSGILYLFGCRSSYLYIYRGVILIYLGG